MPSMTKERTQAATKTHQDNSQFRHQATLALAEKGHSRAQIAALLDISLRSVRRLLNQPNAGYSNERTELLRRMHREHFVRTKQGGTPFLTEFVDDWVRLPTREKVRRYMLDGC